MIKLKEENNNKILGVVTELEDIVSEWQKVRALNLRPIHEINLCYTFANTMSDVLSPQPYNIAAFESRAFQGGNMPANPILYLLHIPRCGGNSVLKILDEYKIPHCIAHSVDTETGEFIRELSHISAKKDIVSSLSFGAIEKEFLDVNLLRDNKCEIFSVVRNPFSWLVSFYFFGKKEISNPEHGNWDDKDAVLGVGNVRRWFLTWEKFFEFFIKEVEDTDALAWMFPFRENPFFQLYDLENNLITEKIIKLENLDEDLSQYFSADIKSPISNQGSAEKPYQHYYTPEMKKAFENRYGFLLEEFGYNFDGLIND